MFFYLYHIFKEKLMQRFFKIARHIFRKQFLKKV